jgi:Ca-activated chloride channel family protein
MQWEHPAYLYMLLAIPVMLGLFVWSLQIRSRQLRVMGDPELVVRMMQHYSLARRWWKTILLLLALACFILAAANLRMGSRREKVQAKSSEVIICFDVSRSMQAEDIQPDRLTRARILAAQIIESLSGNKIGLIVFAGKAYVQMPLTVDTRAALMYLNTVNTDMVQTQGTAIGEALQTALTAFEQGGVRQGKNQAIILITDGESHDDNALAVAAEVADANIPVIAIGVGTPKGAPIPVKKGGQVDYKKDNAGNIVLTKLNESMLQELAAAGNGTYLNLAAGRTVLQTVEKEIAALDKDAGQEYQFAEYRSHFQVFLLLGILFLMLELVLSDRSSGMLKKWMMYPHKTDTP